MCLIRFMHELWFSFFMFNLLSCFRGCRARTGESEVIFANITCEAPTLEQPIPQPGGGEVNIDTSMFVFYTSFGGSYPSGNSIYIKGWNFKNLQGTGQVGRKTWQHESRPYI